jgi:hypothetical protein
MGMNTQALITMVLTNLVFIGFTAYFFRLVLKSPLDKPENDDVEFPHGG